ncbi:MAG: formyltransferase family protein [Woeseiaceae bacterium]
MKIIFIGSASTLSLVPFKALIESNEHQLCAFAYDQESDKSLDVLYEGSIQSLAFKQSIPLIKFDHHYLGAIEKIKSLQPDVIFVSCYSRLLPETITSIPKLGCFNLHPSLLPAFRGPTPLFWQLHAGDTQLGVSIHRVSNVFDQGNIVGQKQISIADGVLKDNINILLANAGSELLFSVLSDIDHIKELKQDESLASYQSFYSQSDYCVETSWSAKRIYNFIKAYQSTTSVFKLEIEGDVFFIREVLSYQIHEFEELVGQSYYRSENNLKFACQQGYIECLIENKL